MYWLLFITLWAFLGFYVQSRWTHSDNNEEFLVFGNKESNGNTDTEQGFEIWTGLGGPTEKIGNQIEIRFFKPIEPGISEL